jgi:hypothetical protein
VGLGSFPCLAAGGIGRGLGGLLATVAGGRPRVPPANRMIKPKGIAHGSLPLREEQQESADQHGQTTLSSSLAPRADLIIAMCRFRRRGPVLAVSWASESTVPLERKHAFASVVLP